MTLTLTKSVRNLVLLLAAFGALATAGTAAAAQEVIKQTPTTVFPIKITRPGSHVLTSNLILTGGTDAIDVNANYVSINLNGFSIIGPGGGSGVGINGANNVGISVTNGNVTKMGSRGLLLGDDALVKGVNAIGNGSDGIAAGHRSVVVDCGGNQNAGAGIVCGDDCLIEGNTADANAIDGMYIGGGSTIIHNAAGDNQFFGLATAANAGYGKNVWFSNAVGCVTFGTSMGDNICNGNRL
jgi:hypothetical protein